MVLSPFLPFQPDLNLRNPYLLAEIKRILGYWLQQGVAGFRLDAVPFMIEVATPGNNTPPQQYEIIPELQRFVQWHSGDAIILGEANVPPKDNVKYFGKNGEGLQMMFNFYVNQYLFYAFATGKISPFVKALQDTREKPAPFQWAYFLRNHDEIDLGRLSKEQRNEVYKVFGPDTSMQLYDRVSAADWRRCLVITGSCWKCLTVCCCYAGHTCHTLWRRDWYGDDLRLQERLAVRTPMQWSAARQAGFSTADTLFRPVISSGEYGYAQINVATQERDANSLLHFIKEMIMLRHQCPEIGLGEWQVQAIKPSVLMFQYQKDNKVLVMLHNFTDKESTLPSRQHRKIVCRN
ncbi:alpha-amylase family glycosyl hydrolase [Chitinophaga pinensis]|uniref:Glycosyl hydrolase family 13 catalytic domain-containing protein n=1 Tax=Chitinophaga pinensis TaxID=79329 RepID=A0A5C6LI22_9BACT|nr:alpha-amylase family glycosyl hydrolase [Chitinophaga pinensis]TWV90754.1 hypothetical protein FEF09_29265 [Chitinophaga pinensis]